MAIFLKESTFSGRNGTHFKLILEYEATLQQENNAHEVVYSLYFQSLDGYSGSGSTVYGYINEVQVGTTTSIGKNVKLLMGTKTETISHNTGLNEDGTKTVNYSAKIDTPWTLGDAEISGSFDLPRINRESTWAFTNNFQMLNIEDTLVLQINKYNVSYTNKVTISNLQMTEIVRTIDNVENGFNLKFTQEELEQIYTLDNNKNQNNLTFYLNLYTYDGNNNQVGEFSRSLMNGYLINANPTISYEIEETSQNVIDLFEGDRSCEYLIGNASKPKITIIPTALKGSIIKIISITNGTQANGGVNPYTFENVQNGVFTITVTDSRGNTSPETINKQFINYQNVKINTYSFERENQTSSNIILNADITCFSGSINSIQNVPQVFYKVGTSEEYVEISNGFTFENNKIIFNNHKLENILPYNQESRVYLYVLDLLSEDIENEIVTKGIPTCDMGEHDFQVNGELILADENRENPYNVAGCEIIGTEDNYAIKHSDGRLEVYQSVIANVECNNVWGSLYTSGPVSYQAVGLSDFPVEFYSIPNVNIDIQQMFATFFLITGNDNDGNWAVNTKNIGYLQFARAITGYGEVKINVKAHGFWKEVL